LPNTNTRLGCDDYTESNTMARLPDGRALPGRRFDIEGIDGPGKGTELELLSGWLVVELL